MEQTITNDVSYILQTKHKIEIYWVLVRMDCFAQYSLNPFSEDCLPKYEDNEASIAIDVTWLQKTTVKWRILTKSNLSIQLLNSFKESYQRYSTR